MLLYFYDTAGIFLNASVARPCPARPVDEQGQERIILPARAATNPPPALDTGSVAVLAKVLTETDQRREVIWEVKEDHRGAAIYSTADKTQTIVTSLGPIPDGYTEVAPPGKLYSWSGSAWVPDVAAMIAAAKDAVDALAESKRQVLLTAGVGMQAAYEKKESQARAYLDATEPNDADYPYLGAEVGITADTIKGVAEVIKAAADKWWSYGAGIERTRLQAKKSLAAATTTGEIDSIINAVAWPSVPE